MQTKSKEILETVKRVIIKSLNLNIGTEDIQDNALIYEDLGIDSVDSLDLVINLENEFGIQFPDMDRSFMQSVSTLAQKVEEYIENQK